MDVMTLARRKYVERQLLARRAVLAVRKAWSGIDPKAIRASWAITVGPAVYAIVTGAQFDAAAQTETTTAAILAAQGLPNDPTGLINPWAFSGIASDGRDLATLLELSNLYALKSLSLGQTIGQALTVGGKFLELVTGTQVVDAGRVADGVATAARPTVTGFYRVLSPPSCERCIVLAGRWYRWDAGFERHPRCDCTSIPAEDKSLDDHPHLLSPRQYFDSLNQAEQDRIFGLAGASAIREGADLGQVVNAKSGMYTASGRVLTTVGTAYRNGGVRLMPEQILAEANGNRDEAIRLLRLFGYLR